MRGHVLEVSGLTTEFGEGAHAVRAVDDVSLTVRAGEVLGIVGQAGGGKSVLVRSILGLLPENAQLASGSVRFMGQELVGMSSKQLRAIRGTGIAPILPNARQQLNPVVSVGEMMLTVMRAHQKVTIAQARERAVELLTTVGISDPLKRLEAYPHELSGGMAQRVCIALALIHQPALLVADEPTHGLDVTVQRQVLDLMASLVRNRQAAQLVVTRDLGIVAHYCRRVAVMQAGRIVEVAPTVDLFENPQHEHTKALLAATKLQTSVVVQ